MSDCIFNACNLDPEDNTNEMIHDKLQDQLTTLMNTSTAKHLVYEGKLGELCDYLKKSLSNSIRELLYDMEHSGEFAEIIRNSVLQDLGEVVSKTSSCVTPQMFGASGNGIIDDTKALQTAINYCMSNNIGQLLIPDGTYLVSKTLTINKEDRLMNFEIKGVGNPHIVPNLDSFKGDYLLTIDPNVTDMNEFKRYITIRDIVFGHNGDNDQGLCSGLYIRQTQFLNMDNVMIRGFKKSGLILRDVFDSMVHNVRILNCGDVTGTVHNDDYALLLQGEVDNVNATHFYGLHIERCPLMLKVQSKIRHCQFTDCKLEQTVGNFTDLPTIFIDGRSGENTFTNCQFVKNSTDGNNSNQYFITTSEATSYSESAQFFLLLNGCLFTCSPKAANTGHWLNTDGAVITNCHFNHCGGNADGMYSFRLVANNIFKGNKVYVTSWNTNTFMIKGENNQIKDNIISYMAGSDINAGVFLAMDQTYRYNVIEGNDIKGDPFQPYAVPGNYFGQSVIRNNIGREITTIGNENGEPVIQYGSDTMVIEYQGVLPIYRFRFGYHGQKLRVLFRSGSTTLNHNTAALNLKNGKPYTPKAREVVEFICLNNIWYQV